MLGVQIEVNHLKSLLNDSILCSSSDRAGRPLDLRFTFSTCHSLLKCWRWSWAVAKTAVSPQLVHLMAFSSFCPSSFLGFSGLTSSSGCSSFSLSSSSSSRALNCSVSRPLFSSLTMTPTSTSTTTLSSFLQTWLISRYLLGSMLQVRTSWLPFTSSFSTSSTSTSCSRSSSCARMSCSNVSRIFISPRAILQRFWSSLMQSRACFLAGWSSFSGKWTYLMASLMFSGVKRRLVAGCTHFSTMILTMSARMLPVCASRSLSLTCSSPRSRMISMISRLVLLAKNLLRSAFLASTPWEAFSQISSICSTSERSSSRPLRQFTALLRQHAISKFLLLILQRIVATFVMRTFVSGCFNIILLQTIPNSPQTHLTQTTHRVQSQSSKKGLARALLTAWQPRGTSWWYLQPRGIMIASICWSTQRVITKLSIKQMGACCQNQVPQSNLTEMLRKALERQGMPQLKPDDRNAINQLMQGTTNSYKTTEYELILQQRFHFFQPQRENESGTLSRLIYRPANASNNKGLIIYEDGYYCGEIINNSADSHKAVLYFKKDGTEEEYIVRGSWEKDDLKKGEVSKVGNEEKVLFEIQRKSGHRDTAIIKFRTGEMLSYEGTIDWSKLDLPAALTGKGTIQFQNGSVYTGGVKNGLMDTQTTKETATFKTLREGEIYEGHYKDGLRHGEEGKSLIKLESMRYSYTLNWANGIPDLDSFVYNNRDPRETYLKSRVGRF